MQLKGIPDWEATDDSSDAIKILKIIRSLLHQEIDQKYHSLSLYTEIKSAYWLQKGTTMKNAQLLENMEARVEVVEEIYGSMGTDPKIIEYELNASLKEIGVNAYNTKDYNNTEAQRRSW